MSSEPSNKIVKGGSKTGWIIWIIGWLFTLGVFFGSAPAAEYFTTATWWDKVGLILIGAIILFPAWPIALGAFLSYLFH